MPFKVTVHTTAFPQIQFAGIPFSLGANQAHEVTDEQKESIEEQWETFSPAVKHKARLGFVAIPGKDEAIADAPAPTPASTPEPVSTPEPSAPTDVDTLSDDDYELIEIEVSKLKGKIVADERQLIDATIANADLSRELRIAYLEAIVTDDRNDISKTNKTYAEEQLKELNNPDNA